MQRPEATPPSAVATLSDAAQSAAQKKINRRSLEFPQRKIFDAQCVLDKVKKSYSFDQDCDGAIVAKIVEDRFAGTRKVQLASEKSEKLKTRIKPIDDESIGEQFESNDSSSSDKCAVIENNEKKSQFGFKLLSDYLNSRKQDSSSRGNVNCDIRDKNSVNNVGCHTYNKPLVNSNKLSVYGKSQLNSVCGGAEDVIGRDRAPVHLRQRTGGGAARSVRCRSTPPWGGSWAPPWAAEQAESGAGAGRRLCRTWYGGYGTLYETEEAITQRILTEKTVPVTTVAALNGGTGGGQQDGGSGGARRRVEGRRRPRPPPSPRLSASALSLNILPRLSAAVIPLKRGGLTRSAATLLEDGPLLAQGPPLRKCETMVALGEPQRAVNRLRVCSRCSSLLSLAGGGSRYSLAGGGFVPVSTSSRASEESVLCKLCLEEVPKEQVTTISHCNCSFCTKCMQAYAEYEIMNGAYDISCPDSKCPRHGVMAQDEVEALVSPELVDKHRKFRLNHEVAMDGARAFCPRVGCETVCRVGSCSNVPASVATPQAVRCPTCDHHFCSACTNQWHAGMDCTTYSRQQAMMEVVEGLPAESDLIKWCPMCRVPIEKDEGCAQMMCKRCKHVFCWYCLASLDDDFLLRHYDKGPCKNKLGHSRASVIWHRAQVLGIFAGFGLLLLVASPLLLLAAPCIVCCKCRLCNSNGGKTIDGDDHPGMDTDPEDGVGDEIQNLNNPVFD